MNLFVEILKSIVYGVIEGITEWLPISSTGHMILAEQVLHFQLSDDFMEMFRVVIQLGAILAVVAGGPSVVQNYRRLHPCRRAGPSAGRLDGRTSV